MTARERSALLTALQRRFEQHRHRHAHVVWREVLPRLETSPAALKALAAMESSGGEPDVIGIEAGTGQLLWCDCSAESPAGRRSLCFDDEALHARKENRSADSALGGALFGDRRYGRVFVYHNGAQSYYAARGFRALLRV